LTWWNKEINIKSVKDIQDIYYYLQINLMATRAKYNRVRPEEQKEDKPETDIIMKFSPTYGI